MSPEAQRIAIANALGWYRRKWNKNTFAGKSPVNGWSKVPESEIPNPEHPWDKTCVEELPDYLHDLNAINDAERSLDESQELTYRIELQDMFPFSMHSPTMAIRATAAQRCEAFLRTLNKWDDSK